MQLSLEGINRQIRAYTTFDFHVGMSREIIRIYRSTYLQGQGVPISFDECNLTV